MGQARIELREEEEEEWVCCCGGGRRSRAGGLRARCGRSEIRGRKVVVGGQIGRRSREG